MRLKSVCFCYGDNNLSSDAINSLSKNINELINNSVFNVYLDTYDFIKSDFNMKITDKNMSEIDNVFVKEMLNELEFAMYKKCKLECNLNDTKQVVKQNIKIHKI